jgi:dolichyl-diphosphooligosaccharide--protein glycosyltransferase/undecaprenyl-diphosphooligosaccharide--protein glycosyltransferase
MKIFDFNSSLKNRGFFTGFVELPKDRAHWSITLFFITLAYLLSFWVRLEWIDFAQAHYTDENGEVQYLRPDMVKNGVALPNTHDSFYFGSILQKAHLGMHENNHLIPSVFQNGMITYLPYLLLKFFPSLDIELLLLWIPVYVAGLVCIPIVLIGRLYGSSLWGFFAACLAGITHSYYNRTLAGYYDTDMFSITLPAFALYFLIAASRKESLGYLLSGVVALYFGRFFYGSIQAITCSMALSFLVLRWGIALLDLITFARNTEKFSKFDLDKNPSFHFACISTFFISWFLYFESRSAGIAVELNSGSFISALAIPILLYFVFKYLQKTKLPSNDFEIDQPGGSINTVAITKVWGGRIVQTVTAILIILFVLGITPFINLGPFSGTWSKITGKLESYSVIAGKSVKKNTSPSSNYYLHFKDVKTTIREASEIPPDVVRNRILADAPSCSCPRCLPGNEKADAWILPTAILGFLGLVLLILRYWEFCLTLPFLAIAYYCFKGAVGLRFTVHVGNAASMGLVFLILVLCWAFFRVTFFKSANISAKFSDLIKWGSWGLAGLIVCFFALPNIQHAKNYNSHVVYPIKTIEVLKKLNEVSKPDDFVVTWWDYGSGCWFYGNTRTFTSPAHQTFDNFLTSEILRSQSPSRAANLSRLKTETFVDLQEKFKSGASTQNTAVQAIFNDGTPELKFYQGLINDIADDNFSLPDKTRDIFLFLPYEILRIFPTILSFSSRNLYFPQNNTASSSGSRDPPMMILKNGRREGSSLVFDGGYRLDRRGLLRMEGKNSGIIPYGQIFEVNGNGLPSKQVNSISWGGLNIPANVDPLAARRILFIHEKGELVILSPETFRSSFAKRFLLDKFDQQVYGHPLFEKSPFPVNSPYMAQADWVTQSGQTLTLNMRGGYRIDADLAKNLARIPGVKDLVPFNFHRSLYQGGKMVRQPSRNIPNARFHLVQTNLPVFLGGRTFEIPKDGMQLEEVAKMHGLNPQSLIVSTGYSMGHHFDEFEKLEIPAKGYELRPAFFFIDSEVFNSVLIQGFLMENLDPKYFELVFASPWGKVFKILK